jgi:hypothetical protein
VRKRVTRWIVEPRDPLPPFPQPKERLLHDLLRLVAISGDEAERPEQPSMLRAEELLEALGVLSHLGPYDIVVAQHAERALHHGP